jgi:hypothetical protein
MNIWFMCEFPGRACGGREKTISEVLMRKLMLLFTFLLFNGSLLVAQEYRIDVTWDAFSGEAEAVLQYYRDGRYTMLRGSYRQGSDDGFITIERTGSVAQQSFIINQSAAAQINIWLLNSLALEGMSDPSASALPAAATVTVTDLRSGVSSEVVVPADNQALAMYAGRIGDGLYTPQQVFFRHLNQVRVKLVHALSGLPLAEVSVALNDFRGAETIATGLSNKSGIFSHNNLQFGRYQLHLASPGFMAANYEFAIDQTELPFFATLAMAPATDKLRIVLTWQGQPEDLDAHLSGPDPEGGRFHIWYHNMREIGGKNFLDRDDKNGYGPETITIYRPAAGRYRYAVHNYSDRHRQQGRRLSMSGAMVQVYNQRRLIATYQVAQGQQGNVWYVFDIDQNFILQEVNMLSSTSSDSEVFD